MPEARRPNARQESEERTHPRPRRRLLAAGQQCTSVERFEADVVRQQQQPRLPRARNPAQCAGHVVAREGLKQPAQRGDCQLSGAIVVAREGLTQTSNRICIPANAHCHTVWGWRKSRHPRQQMHTATPGAG
jgi:hypothetical protein